MKRRSDGRPLRIAQVATVASSVRALLRDQIDALTAWGADVTAICAPGPEVPELERSGLRVQAVAMERQPAPVRDLAALWRLAGALRQGRYDVVITHTPKAGLIGPAAAQLAGVPVVIHTVHGFLFHDQMPAGRARAFELAERWTGWWADDLFFQSREDRETAERLGIGRPGRRHHIGNGIDLSRFDPARAAGRAAVRAALGIAPDALVVGTVARLAYEKGLGEFLEAAQLLMPSFPNMQFLVVGPAEPGRPDAVPGAVCDALAATGRFIFTGERRDLPDLYSAMDLFVLASHREGIPRALMEASCMGLPVVATAIRGCREVVADGVTGLLVPVRDAGAVAAAVTRVIGDGNGRQLGAAGRERIVAEFDAAGVHRRLIGALEQILGRQG